MASKLTYRPISYKVLYSGSNVVITSDEAFEGYVVLV